MYLLDNVTWQVLVVGIPFLIIGHLSVYLFVVKQSVFGFPCMHLGLNVTVSPRAVENYFVKIS